MPAHYNTIDNAANKLKKIKEFIDNGMVATLDVALDLEERQEGTEQAKELQDVMVEYAQMEREINHWIEAVDQTKTQFTKQSGPSSDEVPDIEAIFQEKLDALESTNNDSDLHNHKRVTEFEKKVWKVHHEGQPLPKQGGAGVEVDEDLIMSQATEQTKCPITTKEMVKPMKNKKCGHNYEKDAIEYIIKKAKRGQAKCPIGGCPQLVTKDDLEPNIELERSISRKNRKK